MQNQAIRDVFFLSVWFINEFEKAAHCPWKIESLLSFLLIEFFLIPKSKFETKIAWKAFAFFQWILEFHTLESFSLSHFRSVDANCRLSSICGCCALSLKNTLNPQNRHDWLATAMLVYRTASIFHIILIEKGVAKLKGYMNTEQEIFPYCVRQHFFCTYKWECYTHTYTFLNQSITNQYY